MRAIVRTIGISSRSSAGHLGVKELSIHELLQARKFVIKKVGTDDNPADFGTKCTEDGKKFVHLLGLSGLRMKRGLELTTFSVATVVWQGCASIVNVEGTVTGSIVSLEMVIAVATGVSWLVDGGLVVGGPIVYSQGEQ